MSSLNAMNAKLCCADQFEDVTYKKYIHKRVTNFLADRPKVTLANRTCLPVPSILVSTQVQIQNFSAIAKYQWLQDRVER